MNKIKFLLIFIVLLSVSLVFAQNVAVGFKDTTTATKTLINTEFGTPSGYPSGYPFPTPLTGFDKWYVQFYTDGEDGIISNLNADGTPGGDDVLSIGIANTTQGLSFAPNGALSLSAATFTPVGSGGNTHPGSKIYLRIFNAKNIATATKYINFTNLYTVTTGATQNVTIIPTYGWSEWITKAVTPLVSGSFSSPIGATAITGVRVDCTGQNYFTTTSAGTYNFSVPTGSNITITPSKTGYYFTPASASYTNVTEAISGIDFVMTKMAPNAATTPGPATGASGVQVNIGQVTWQFTPQEGYSLPTGFKVLFPSDATPIIVPYVSGTTNYSCPIPLLTYNTLYGWKAIATNSNKGADAEDEIGLTRSSKNGTKADGEAAYWSFTTQSPPNITPGITASVDPDGGGSMGVFYFDTPPTDLVPTTPVIIYTLIPLENVPTMPGFAYIARGFAMNMHASGSTSLTVTVPVGTWYVSAYYNGAWHSGNPHPATGPTTVVFDNIPFGAKGDVQAVFNEGGDPTLPVELSSFTAIYSAGFFVQLTWEVQSETNHLGYNVLRNTSEDVNSAVQINQSFISTGAASGSQITYNYRDEEVEDQTTYYYWLQSVDLDNTTYLFGPVQVLVNNDGEPEVPPIVITSTELLNAYPNPFNPVTTIPYTLKTPGEVKIEIYNVKGQVVWSYDQNHAKAGYYQIAWNGKDYNGKAVSSGIYYYRMNSGKYSASKKIILVK